MSGYIRYKKSQWQGYVSMLLSMCTNLESGEKELGRAPARVRLAVVGGIRTNGVCHVC